MSEKKLKIAALATQIVLTVLAIVLVFVVGLAGEAISKYVPEIASFPYSLAGLPVFLSPMVMTMFSYFYGRKTQRTLFNPHKVGKIDEWTLKSDNICVYVCIIALVVMLAGLFGLFGTPNDSFLLWCYAPSIAIHLIRAAIELTGIVSLEEPLDYQSEEKNKILKKIEEFFHSDPMVIAYYLAIEFVWPLAFFLVCCFAGGGYMICLVSIPLCYVIKLGKMVD